MKIRKGFLISLITVVLLLLVLIIVKATSRDQFRNNAEKWAERSIDHTNLISPDGIEKSEQQVMLVYLNPSQEETYNNSVTLHTSAAEIMNKDIISKIRKHDGPKVLISEDSALSARLWMLLSQTGIRELYILETK